VLIEDYVATEGSGIATARDVWRGRVIGRRNRANVLKKDFKVVE